MGKNLKVQFHYAIEQNFKLGMDKHAYKKQKSNSHDKVFSYADRKNLIDVSSNFSNFMKEEYPNIKFIRDIKHSVMGRVNLFV